MFWLILLSIPVLSLSECPTGTKSSTDGCEECPTGKYQDESSQESCKFCAAGTYRFDAISCKDCPIGTYRDVEGAMDITQCKDCTTDMYQDVVGQQACKDCDKAQYQNEFGKTECKGTVTNAATEEKNLYLYCPHTCPEIACVEGKERCLNGVCRKHTCTDNAEASGCVCYGTTCNKWCMDNGECVDVLEDPVRSDLENAFLDNGVSQED